MNLPDIYFESEWGKLYAIKDNGIHQTFLFSSNNGQVYYSYVKRMIDIKIDNEIYYDIITPYGFSGPIVLDFSKNNKEQLLKEFKFSFDNYCIDNRIVTDLCRFSPWLKNHIDFKFMYEIVPNYTTFGINLNVDNILIDEFSKKKRNMIRKAEKIGIVINYDYSGEKIDTFLSIYKKTIEKHNIIKYYEFSKDFLIDNFNKLKGKIFIAYAKYEGNIISIAIFLQSDNYIHYHLAANEPNYIGVPGNDFLLYKVAEYGKKNGLKYLMLGGTGDNKDIYHHKKGFTKNSEFDFFKGRRVCMPVVYEKILKSCKVLDFKFFPSYR